MKLKFGVAEFAQPLERRGSITREGLLAQLDLGIVYHQKEGEELKKVQPGYKTEVFIEGQLKIKPCEITLSGRMDGFLEEKSLIEEFKTTGSLRKLRAQLDDPYHPYRLQALVYGYLYYLKTTKTPIINLRLLSIRGQGSEVWPLEFDLEFIEDYLEKRVDHILAALKEEKARQKRRKALAKTLKFPFSQKRRHQDDLIELVEKVFLDAGQALVQAPTGIGKTMGTLLPGWRQSLKRGAALIYTAPKNQQFELCEQASSLLVKGKKRRVLTLTSKRKACLNDKLLCDGEHCPFANEFYSKLIDQDIFNKLEEKDCWDLQTLKEVGKDLEVCPYYLSYELIDRADLLICDYHYFMAKAPLLPATLPIKPGILVDEAHNLIERAIEEYSPRLYHSEIDRARDSVGSFPMELHSLKDDAIEICANLSRLIAQYQPDQSGREIGLKEDDLLPIKSKFIQFLTEWVAQGTPFEEEEPLLQLFFSLLGLCDLLDELQPGLCSTVIDERGDCSIGFTCLDPSPWLKERFQQFVGVVMFSATLKPFSYYQKLSGLKATARIQEFPSPFQRDHRKLLIVPQVSTAFKDRRLHYSRIADAIIRMAEQALGHYFIFCPSYAYLNLK